MADSSTFKDYVTSKTRVSCLCLTLLQRTHSRTATPKIKSKYSRIFSTWHGKAVCAVVVTVVGSDAGVPETDVQGGFAGGGERQ